jgi:lysozyme
MDIPDIAISLIKKHEGFSSRVYLCPAGYKTIGYGHVLRQGEAFNQEISKADAEAILYEDLQFYAIAVYSMILVPINTMQFASLLSFTFNLGSAALERSTLRQKLNRLEYFAAANEFLKWVFANGVRLNGLVKRRQDERDLFLS